MEHIKTIIFFIFCLALLLIAGWFAIQYRISKESIAPEELEQACPQGQEVQQCMAGPCCCPVGVNCI